MGRTKFLISKKAIAESIHLPYDTTIEKVEDKDSDTIIIYVRGNVPDKEISTPRLEKTDIGYGYSYKWVWD